MALSEEDRRRIEEEEFRRALREKYERQLRANAGIHADTPIQVDMRSGVKPVGLLAVLVLFWIYVGCAVLLTSVGGVFMYLLSSQDLRIVESGFVLGVLMLVSLKVMPNYWSSWVRRRRRPSG